MIASLIKLGFDRGLPLWTAIALLISIPVWSLLGGGNLATVNAVQGVDATQTPGLVRMGVWSGISSFLLIVAAWRGSRAGSRFATSDRHWLTTRLQSPHKCALWIVMGAMLSVFVVLGGLGIGVEISGATRDHDLGSAFLKTGNLPSQDLVMLSASSPETMEARWVIADPKGRLDFEQGEASAPHLLFVPTALMGNGPSALLTATATRAGPSSKAGQSSSVTKRIRGTSNVILPVPRGSGDLLIVLTHGGDGPPIRLSQSRSGMLLPRGSIARASLNLWLRASLWIAGALALSVGLGSTLGPTLGMLGALALQLLGFEAYLGATLGGQPWLNALTVTGEGFISPAPGLLAVAGFLGQLAVGTLLLAKGIRLKTWQGGAA